MLKEGVPLAGMRGLVDWRLATVSRHAPRSNDIAYPRRKPNSAIAHALKDCLSK